MCPLSDCHDKDAITGMTLVQLSFLYIWFLLVLHNFNCRYMTLAHEPILHLLVSRLSSETLIQRNLFSECLKLWNQLRMTAGLPNQNAYGPFFERIWAFFLRTTNSNTRLVASVPLRTVTRATWRGSSLPAPDPLLLGDPRRPWRMGDPPNRYPVYIPFSS